MWQGSRSILASASRHSPVWERCGFRGPSRNKGVPTINNHFREPNNRRGVLALLRVSAPSSEDSGSPCLGGFRPDVRGNRAASRSQAPKGIMGTSLLAGAAQLMSHRIYERNKAIDTDRVARPRYHWILIADYMMVGC